VNQREIKMTLFTIEFPYKISLKFIMWSWSSTIQTYRYGHYMRCSLYTLSARLK